MTVGELARRTGLSHKAIRELEGRGLIYSAGRSESNYRLFDETALWCVGAVGEMRSLGLTLAEIEQLHDSYLKDSDRPPSAEFVRLLDRAEERIHAQIAAHQQTLGRIEAFRARPSLTVPAQVDADRASHRECSWPSAGDGGRVRTSGPA